MNVVLINPPSPYLRDAKAQAPMGLLYLAAVLEKHGHRVSIVDLAGDDRWIDKVLTLHADVFGVSCTTPNVPIVEKIFKMLPSMSLKIAGGAHPTFLPEESLQRLGCDIVVTGEGEEILPKIIDGYEQSGYLQYEPEKAIYSGGLCDLNKLPLPARHLVNLSDYSPEMEGKATTMFTSRGCNKRCAFCAKLTGNVVRFHSVEKVMEELGLLVNHYGYKNIIFEDDNFCLHKPRVQKICREIIRRQMDINIRICPRADSVDLNLLQLLRKAGVTEISFGIESGSQKMLDHMKKGVTIKTYKRTIQDAKRAGMLVKIYLIVAFPFETDATIEETKSFVVETQPDKWLLQTFIPYPHTDVWLHPRKYRVTWISQDYSQYYTVGKEGLGGVVFTTKTLSKAKIHEMHADLYNFLMDYKPMRRS